ncbi:Uncharacterized protein Adt_12225 [Abeliophyllum distichum]|uniref:Uncharacterized protein n=1 Tax=Abeliophyllum distichum TaxID=126358 RepID=A0ABD1UQ50_9LAMI
MQICLTLFEELATRVHDLKIHIARHGSYLPSNLCDKKDPKKEIKRGGKLCKPKETMTISIAPAKIIFQKPGSNPGPKPKLEFRPNKVTPKEESSDSEENDYLFSNYEVSRILDQLL